MSVKMPAYFISHGGGPWPWVPDLRKLFGNLERSLKQMVMDFPAQPKAILMISGHWETESVQVMASDKPPMLYDYHGFPQHTYEVVYAAPGAPTIADRVVQLLNKNGIDASQNLTQGYDHGSFAPMEIMYPKADMPLLQLSILQSYDPISHISIGEALAPLRDEGVAIIGSGLSFHNLRMMGPASKKTSAAFDRWLNQSLELPQAERLSAIKDWESAPHARECHPQEDHLVPLFVALGAAQSEHMTRIYHETELMGGITASSYRFG